MLPPHPRDNPKVPALTNLWVENEATFPFYTEITIARAPTSCIAGSASSLKHSPVVPERSQVPLSLSTLHSISPVSPLLLRFLWIQIHCSRRCLDTSATVSHETAKVHAEHTTSGCFQSFWALCWAQCRGGSFALPPLTLYTLSVAHA